MKNQKGITLIALVITIIVLLILAGVSIAMLTGQNGILTKASGASEKSTVGEIDEAIKLACDEILANKNDPTYTGSDKTIDSNTFGARITANNSNINTTDDAKIKITVEAVSEPATSDPTKGTDKVKVTYTGNKGTEYTWTITDKGYITKT